MWACQRGWHETIHDGQLWRNVSSERVPCHSWPIHRETATFPVNLCSSLVILISCLFFKNARKGIGCSSALINEHKAHLGATRAELSSLLPDAKLKSCPRSSCHHSYFPSTADGLKAKLLCQSCSFKADGWSVFSAIWMEGFGFPPSYNVGTALHVQFCTCTSLLGPGKQAKYCFQPVICGK